MTSSSLSMMPVKGGSGNAFVGESNNKRVFIKKNCSLFLTSVYLEGITPQVLWTKRTAEGDMLAAQPWINGHTLKPYEMNDSRIGEILRHLHQSEKLIEACKKLDNEVMFPADLLEQVLSKSSIFETNGFLSNVVVELSENLPELKEEEITVVHGDVNHKNWLVDDESDKVYLVDWDTVLLSSPLVDIAHVLTHYIKPENWEEWLHQAGYKTAKNKNIEHELIWYGKLSFLRQISEYMAREQIKETEQEIARFQNFCRLF